MEVVVSKTDLVVFLNYTREYNVENTDLNIVATTNVVIRKSVININDFIDLNMNLDNESIKLYITHLDMDKNLTK